MAEGRLQRAGLGRTVGVMAAALFLHACATTAPQSPIPPAPPPMASLPGPERPPPQPWPPAPRLTFADLPGWEEEDHAAALDAFRAGCGVSKDPDLVEVCERARALGPQDGALSRAFIEASFQPEAVGDEGLLTAYFAPQYEARTSRGGEFTAPVRARPSDMVVLDLGPFDAQFQGKRVTGRVSGGRFEPYPDRAAIERTAPEKVLAWMRPEELFFLQIQGSGVLAFPDGTRRKAVFSAGNGRPFVGIASVMRDKGLLPDNNTSGDAIRSWLARNRGPQADAIMRANPRYVFFNIEDYDGREPAGAAGVPLPAGRAIAVDPGSHRYGAPYWISAEAPALIGAFPTYRRMTMALDTGGAIKGEVRADLYMGTGERAGIEAGRVRHRLTMIRLKPQPRDLLEPVRAADRPAVVQPASLR